jgi:hypothetical protein
LSQSQKIDGGHVMSSNNEGKQSPFFFRSSVRIAVTARPPG